MQKEATLANQLPAESPATEFITLQLDIHRKGETPQVLRMFREGEDTPIVKAHGDAEILKARLRELMQHLEDQRPSLVLVSP